MTIVCFIVASLYIIGMCATVIMVPLFIDDLYKDVDDKFRLLLVIMIIVMMSWFGGYYLLNRYGNS